MTAGEELRAFAKAFYAANHTGPRPPEPTYYRHVFDWFQTLSDTRSVGLAIGPITHAEICAFCSLNGIAIYPSEVRLLQDMDRIAREAWAAEDTAKSTGEAIAANNPAAVDLMFRRMEARQRVADRKAKLQRQAEGGVDE